MVFHRRLDMNQIKINDTDLTVLTGAMEIFGEYVEQFRQLVERLENLNKSDDSKE